MNPERFGARIKELRDDMGLTQLEFSLRCDVPVGYIGSIETGVKNPTLTTICKLAYGCGLPIAELLREPENQDTKKGELIEQLLANARLLDKEKLTDLIEIAKMLGKY